MTVPNTASKRLLALLMQLYGPKISGRPVLVPVMLPAIQVNSIPTGAET